MVRPSAFAVFEIDAELGGQQALRHAESCQQTQRHGTGLGSLVHRTSVPHFDVLPLIVNSRQPMGDR